MDFTEVVRRRRMVRDYTTDAVDPAVVARALAHAHRAPSAGNTAGWGFVVLDSPAAVQGFWATSTDDVEAPDRWLTGMMRAPVVVVPCSVKAAYLDRYDRPDKTRAGLGGEFPGDESRWAMPYWHLDTAMAALLVLQSITDAGLGGCFFGLVPDRVEAVRRLLGLTDAADDPWPIGAITIGHPAPGATRPRAAGGRRTPWETVVHRGRWGTPWPAPAAAPSPGAG